MQECHEHDAPVGDAMLSTVRRFITRFGPLSKTTEPIIATYRHNHVTVQADVHPKEFCFFFLRWGCREHFVSGCWHSSGRDRGRYAKECWLSTLGVLHPGVPVMWYGHIRDLFPTAEGCKGSRLPNVTLLHWAQQKYALVSCQ